MPPDSRTNKKINTILLSVSCAIIVVGLFLLPYVFNYYFSPDELIRNTTAAIETLTGTTIHIGESQLSLIQGVTFRDVRVLVPESKMKLEPAFAADDALLLRADAFHIQLHRRGLLGLKLSLGKITVTNPEFRFTKLTARKTWNWQMLFGGPGQSASKRRVFGLGPPITLDNGQITFTEVKEGQRLLRGQINFAASAEPQVAEGFYRLALRTWTPQAKGLTLGMDFNPRSCEILAGRLEAIDLRNIEGTLPEPYKTWCRQFKLAGTIGIPEINYRPDDKARVTLVLDNVQGNVPLSAAEMSHPAGTSLLHMTGLNGRIVFSKDDVKIMNVTGRLNDSPCRIEGTYRGYGMSFDNASFSVRLALQNFLCPDYTDPRQQEYIEKYVPWRLRCFFHDFKPRGRIDLDLLASKEANPKAYVSLAGMVQPKHTSAEYYKFPYRLDNLTGSVRLVNGGFELIGLTGFSGGGKAVINGTISEASKAAKIDLMITSSRTPLDDKLFRTLPPRYGQIRKKFNLKGRADATVELHQPYGLNQPWSQTITVAFVEGCGCYEGFKYPLTDVRGVLRIGGDKAVVEDFTGRNGRAWVTINGEVRGLDQAKPEVQIKIGARNVAIDRGLIDLLPPAQAQILRDCRVAGVTDIDGTMADRPDRPFDYKFVCDLKDSRLCYKDFPYPVENLAGRLVVSPEQVVLSGVNAGKGLQKITGAGYVYFRKDRNTISLKIDADNLAVDKHLYGSLDPAQRAIWDALSPSGRINARVELDREQKRPWDWKMAVDLRQAAIRYQRMVAVSDLTGRIAFSPGHAVLSGLTGKVGGRGPAAVEGTVKTRDNLTEIRLSKLEFAGLDLTEDLLATLGNGKLAKALKWREGGTASGRLAGVKIDVAAGRRQTWAWGGTVAFDRVNVGAFDRTATGFDYAGTLAWDGLDGGFALDGKLNLASFNWNGRQITNLQATLSKKKNEMTMTIDPLRGTCAGGQVSGMGKLTFAPGSLAGGQGPAGKTTYGFQLTIDNVDAGSALSLKDHPQTLRGKLRGELYVLGEVDQKYVRLGGGTLEILGAEAMKMPLMPEIYRSLDRPAPDLATFHDITLQFTLEQHKVNFQQIELAGPSLSLVGVGSLNLSNDRIGLDLIAANPKKLDKLPVIPDIVQGAAHELTKIEVRGSLEHPTIKARPLKDISEPLEMFLEGKNRK